MLFYELILVDEGGINAFGLMMSLNMLIETPGGFDYTGADCRTGMEETRLSRKRRRAPRRTRLDGRGDQVAAAESRMPAWVLPQSGERGCARRRVASLLPE